VNEITTKLADLLIHFETKHKWLVEKIETEKALSDEIKADLKKYISHFYAN
jgi:F0F1-type ATP synthase alpha subunit